MLKQLLTLLSCALAATVAYATTPPLLLNPDFTQQDGLGAPRGWDVNGKGHQARVECAPDCVLRLEAAPAFKEGDFTPVMQRMAPGQAAGHRLILSGAIRTDNIADFAALAIGVDGPRGMLATDNMKNRSPKGTTGWTSYEVAVDVPPNARAVVLGVTVKGKGTAWFDKLQLRVDDTVVVPAAVLPEVKIPPRPVPSSALLNDAALRLAPADIPAISTAWRDDVLARRQVIRSLFSDDFSDLQFLKPLLAGKRVIQLGESGHGVAEFNLVKARLIRFLHQQMDFDVLAFESSQDQCFDADRVVGTDAGNTVMQRCIFGVWYNKEVQSVVDDLNTTRKAGGKLTLAGFDTQDSSRFKVERDARMKGMLDALGSPLAARLAEVEKALVSASKPLSEAESAPALAYWREVAALLSANRARLAAAGLQTDEIDLATQAAKSRVRYVRQLAATRGSGEGPGIRDEGMADNLDFLLDTMYPTRKVIVWAHNAHITKERRLGGPKMMGSYVAERRKAEVYTVGLYMNRGAANLNNQQTYPIAPAAPGTMEAVLANGGVKYAFVDFSRATSNAGSSWIFNPIASREWGTQPVTITPAASYDAVIYIDTVTPPELR